MEMYVAIVVGLLIGYFIASKTEKKKKKKVIEVRVPTPIELPNNIVLWIEGVDK